MQPDTDICHVCYRHAIGLGVQADREPVRWLCKECADIAEHIRHRRRLDPYELRALDTGVEAVGEYLVSIQKTDLKEMDELEARMLVRAAWEGCGRGMRAALSEAPF
ncbi:hypothetical protein GJU94_13920 [Brucella sp. 10RB9214]|uniref:DUF6511 domain-containing protein n=1 Tax=unclassified Brucella TaxID=2632610 RepID=UPI000972ACB3|nr:MULTISPECIES: DUF6511 domain-containing protein [unclassified Brucella]APY14297.1 hypothetical protein BKD02_08490 [Brucella sp. 09RB8910]MRN45453.1 hypothetical protein [Brucella sp. 10RB9212]MRN50912.1 hypothetical protein [Brucella sp. 10RB9214]